MNINAPQSSSDLQILKSDYKSPQKLTKTLVPKAPVSSGVIIADTLSLTSDPIILIAKDDNSLKEYTQEINRRKVDSNLQTNPLLMEADKTKYTKELLEKKQYNLLQRIVGYLTKFQGVFDKSPNNIFLGRSVRKLTYLSNEVLSMKIAGDSQELGYQLTLADRTVSSIVNDYREAKEIVSRGGSVTDYENEVKKVNNQKNIYPETLIENKSIFYSDQEKESNREVADMRKAKIQVAIESLQKIDPLKLLEGDSLKNGQQKIIIAVDSNEKLLDPGFRAVNGPIEGKVQTTGIYLGKSFFNETTNPENLVPVIANELFDAYGRYQMSTNSSIYTGAFISSKEYQSLGILYSFMLKNHDNPVTDREALAKTFAEYMPSYYSADLRYDPKEFIFSQEQKTEFDKLTKVLTHNQFASLIELYEASTKYFHQAI
jgi:hypothetical protein